MKEGRVDRGIDMNLSGFGSLRIVALSSFPSLLSPAYRFFVVNVIG